MAKPKSPLLSLGARGTIADTLTFQKRGREHFARKKPIPADPRSEAQLAQRQIYRDAVAVWNALTPEEKQAWRGVCPGLTAYQCFMSSELKYVAPPPPPELTLYEYYIAGDNASHLIYGATWSAQTFTPSIPHLITMVKLLIYRMGWPGEVTVSIRATDESGHPTGPDLCSGTTDGNTLPEPAPYEWREITLGDGHNLNAATKYAIVVRALDAALYNHLSWRLDTSGEYPSGNREWSEDSGVSWGTSAAFDLLFEDWGYPL